MSVAAEPLSRNDIHSLAQILQVSLDYYCKYSSPFIDDYMKRLRAVVGLGYAAVLMDNDTVSFYQNYLDTFLHFRNIRQHPTKTVILSQAVAEMINWAAYLFRLLNYPECYEYFVHTVKETVNGRVTHLYADAKEAQRLLKLIVQKS